MKLMKVIRDAAASVFSKVFTGFIPTISDRISVAGIDKPAESLLWIYLGMKARANSVAQVPLRLSNANDQIIETGSLYSLLDHPNSFMDRVQYLAMIESFLALYDECEIAIIRGESSRDPIELIPMDPRFCHPVVGIHGTLGIKIPMGWYYQSPETGQKVVLDPADVIPIISYSPYDTTRALWPSKPGRRAMLVDILTQEQNLAIFKNGGMPDVVFETDQRWTKEDGEEFLDRWNDRYGGGPAQTHKAGILTGGLKARPLGSSPKELEFFEARRMSRQEQIALISVKPAMVALMEGETGLSQGSSTVEQKAAWWCETGLFELARIASAHQRFLVNANDWSARGSRAMTREEKITRSVSISRVPVARKPGANTITIWFDEYEIEELMDQRLKKVEIFGKLLGCGYKPDESSEYLKLRLPPHPTNQATLPFNLQPVSDVGSEPATVKPAERSVIDASLFDELERSVVALIREESESIPPALKPLVNKFNAFVSEREKAAAKKWSRYFSEQRDRVLARMKTAVAREDKTPKVSVDDLLPEKEERDQMGLRILPLLRQHLMDGIYFFSQETGEDAKQFEGLNIDDPRFFKALEAREIQASHVNETTRAKLKEMLKAGYEAGDTTVQLADRIDAFYRDNMTGEKKHRPMTAAQTQTGGIVNEGRLMAAREVQGLLKTWIIGGSSEHRAAHVEAMQRYTKEPIGLEEKFVVNGHPCDAPGSTDLPVGEVANCACMIGFRKAGSNE